MIGRLLLNLALVTSLAAGVAFAADLTEKRMYEGMRADQPPVIDGKLDDPCWQKAAKTGEFARLRGPEQIQQTFFQVCYDSTHLYIAVTCLEKSPEAVRANVRVDDLTSVMGDDAVEIFLHPDQSSPDYYQFAANTSGARYEARGFDASWNATWQAAATVGKDAWYLECAFSFSSFGRFGVPGTIWGLNVCRDRQAGGETEWSSWSASPAGFHQPDRFGQLIFGGQAGGGDRAVLIECARFAASSITLEARIQEALKTIRESNLQSLDPKALQGLQPRLDAADKSLQGLADLLAQPAPLDTRAWQRVVGDLQKAAEGLDEAAWEIRFTKLLADD